MKTLKDLCSINGVSGNEDDVRSYILKTMKKSKADLKTHVDALGNIIVKVKGKNKSNRTVLFAAHMDEVGFIVTNITDEGYLKFTNVGGIDSTVIYGKTVKINGRYGIIAGKSLHQRKAEEKDSIPQIENLFIDLGVENKKQAEKIVKVGDRVVFDSKLVDMGENLIKARAIDDRAGCALLLRLTKETPEYDITLAFTVQEEVGLRGAATAAYAINPDIAVVIDATTAADVVGVPKYDQVCNVGNGAVVSFMDNATLYDMDLYNFILDVANKENIKVQPKTKVAGGNDAGAVHLARDGVKIAAVSLPCRYLHSPSCVISKKDYEETSKLLDVLSKELTNPNTKFKL